MSYNNIMDYTKETSEYLKSVDIAYRKKMGQYFTKKYVRDILFDNLPIDKTHINYKVCELNCGTGEFILSFQTAFNTPEIYAYDTDNNMVNICKETYKNIKESECINSLLLDKKEYFDYTIGNPPYFEFTPDKTTREKFKDVICGRVNIYSLFIKKSIDVTKKEGYIALVVPPSMNNGSYFRKLREYIVKTCDIVFLKVLNPNEFDDASQTVQILILKKTTNSGRYVFKRNGITIFTEDVKEIEKLYEGAISLKDAGFEVATGNVVWNQNKNILSDDASDVTLIWAHNIQDKLTLNNNTKRKQYIKVNSFNTSPCIVVNRITGCGKNAKLRCCLVSDIKYVTENHVNVITCGDKCRLSLQWLLKQLSSPKNLKAIKHITGNTQLSKTELLNLFPIYIE